MPDLSDAQREAYARARPRALLLDTVELAHPGLSAPLRFVANSDEDVTLPPAVGVAAVTFTALALEIVLPDSSAKEGPGDAQIRLCGVSAKLRAHIMELYATGVSAVVTYREYEIPMVSGAPDFSAVTGPTQIYDRLEIKAIDLTATTASASMSHRDLGAINAPRRIFDRDTYKGLTAL